MSRSQTAMRSRAAAGATEMSLTGLGRVLPSATTMRTAIEGWRTGLAPRTALDVRNATGPISILIGPDANPD